MNSNLYLNTKYLFRYLEFYKMINSQSYIMHLKHIKNIKDEKELILKYKNFSILLNHDDNFIDFHKKYFFFDFIKQYDK